MEGDTIARAEQPKSDRQAQQARTPKHAEGLRAFLYDASSKDREVDLSERPARRLRKDQLLWVDVDLSSREAVDQLRTLVDLDDKEFSEERRVPVAQRGEYFSFTVPALASTDEDAEYARLTCAIATQWVVTAHEGRLAFIDAFDEHVRSDSSLGALTGPSFAASLLEWELNDFFVAVEAVVRATDRLEERILGDNELGRRSLDELAAHRRRLTYLRGGLMPHRYVYATLAHSSFDIVSGSDAAGDFALLGERVEQAVQTSDAGREMIVGAFDLSMTRTAQRTNDVMKALTIISALLLPATVIAGIFGMNMLPKLFLHSWFFVVVIALMVLVSGGLLSVLYRRGWL